MNNNYLELIGKQSKKQIEKQMFEDTAKLNLFLPDLSKEMEIPLSEERVSAGFPSPAEDLMDRALDLNKELVRHPASTFYARVKGLSMIDEGINDGDLLVIDKSENPTDGCLAVCYIDGEFTLKRVRIEKEGILLVPANPKYKAIQVTEENDFMIWGIVQYVIKKV